MTPMALKLSDHHAGDAKVDWPKSGSLACSRTAIRLLCFAWDLWDGDKDSQVGGKPWDRMG